MSRSPVRLIVIGDFGQDLDDENALVLAAGLERGGHVELVAVVANLEPALERARLAKGTLQQIGLDDVPVIVGNACFRGGKTPKHETNVPYMADESELLPWESLATILEDQVEKVTIVCNSGLTDIARLCMENDQLVREKVEAIVIMGGVKAAADNSIAVDEDGFLMPTIGKDAAANNAFDRPAALYIHRYAQEVGIPLTVIMRWAAYGAQMPFSLYDRLAATGNPVGQGILSRQQPSMNKLWTAANSPEGSPERGALPLSRDRQWFVNVFCDGNDPGIGAQDEVWPFVGKFQLYDPMAVLAAVPHLRDQFYLCDEVVLRGVTHRAIGASQARNGVRDADALRAFITEMELDGLNP